MLKTRGYATQGPSSHFEPFDFERRELTPHDVLIKIQFCGVCHSDIHQARNEWGNSMYPMVPGHEMVGRVEKIGSAVTKFKVGETVGVGCFVDSCRECDSCKQHEEQFCEKHTVLTYNGTEKDLITPTYGGYSTQIVVQENYVLHVSPNLPLENVGPLLCAGITTYSPMKRFNVEPGKKIAVVGLGGLGHMAVKFGVAMGAHVTVLSTSPAKEDDAKRLGAHDFIVTKNPEQLKALSNRFDFILDAVSAQHDINLYLNMLHRHGVLALVGVPAKPFAVEAFSLILGGRKLAGSLIGGIRETQEMLDYCAEKNITSDVELIPIQKIDEAYDRTIKGDVRYRFVIDINSLA